MTTPITRGQALIARGLLSYETNPSHKSQARHTKPGQVCHHWIRHRVTCDEYDDMHARAAGHCEICGTPETGTPRKRLVVDHFQGGGLHIVRGLLCDYCNNTVMSCMDGTKNWSEQSWRLQNEALSYAANSWHRASEDQWATIAREVAARLNAREYSPRVSAEYKARYALPWPDSALQIARTLP